MAENFWEQDEVIQPAPAQAMAGSAPGGNPWDDDPIIDDGPGLEIDIVGGTRASDAAAAQAQQPAEGGFVRDLGMGARSVIQGAGSLIGAVGGDAFNHYLVPGEQPSYRDAAAGLADRLGLPAPETGRERVMGDIGEALTGTALTMGAGGALNAGRTALATPSVRTAAADLLTAQPKLQAISTATGAGAAGVARESGAGEGAQLAAGLVGGLAPGAGTASAAATLRGAVRGRSGEQMRQTIDDFAQVGAVPSVGQASGNWFAQGMENLLAGGPTSAGVMNRFAERQADDIGAGLRGLADDMSRNASAERAGRAVVEGVKGEDGFIRATRDRAGQLYDDLRRHIPEDTRVEATNVRQALADLNSEIPGAPSLSRFFHNARLEGIEGALAADTAGVGGVLSRPGMAEAAEGYRKYLQAQADAAAARNADRSRLGMSNFEPVPTAADIDGNVQATLGNMVDERLPYEALQKLRTLVGNELEGSTLLSDVPRSKWKAVYGALTRDMEAAATTPEAKQALSRANAYFNARIKRIDMIDSVIDRNGGPERVFNAAMSGTKDGGTTLRAVMQSLPKDGQRAVTAAVIKRMGMPTPGQAGAEAAEEFSASTFLTNWNRVSPEARRALFDRHGPGFTKQMDRIARVAQNLREGARVYANPSGTANRAAAMTYGASLVGSLFTGGTSGLVLAGGGANALARWMTNPTVVKRLADATVLPKGAIPGAIQSMRVAAERDGDQDLSEVAAVLQQLEQEEAGAAQQK